MNVIHLAAKNAVDFILFPRRWYAGIDHQSVIVRLDAENVLGNSHEGPGGRSRKPGILALARRRRIGAGGHLAVNVWLGAVGGDVILFHRRTDAQIVFKSAVAP